MRGCPLQGDCLEHWRFFGRGEGGDAVEPVDKAVITGIPGAENRVAALSLFAVQVPQGAPVAGRGDHAAAVLSADGLVGGQGTVYIGTVHISAVHISAAYIGTVCIGTGPAVR